MERDLANGQRFVSDMKNLFHLGYFHKKRILDVGAVSAGRPSRSR